MEFTCMNRLDRFIEVIFIKNQFGRLILVEHLIVLRVFVEVPSELKSIVFTHTINLSLLSQVKAMLEPERHLLDFNITQRFN